MSGRHGFNIDPDQYGRQSAGGRRKIKWGAVAMEISRAKFALLQPYLPKQRGNVLHPNLDIVNAILWLAQNDCKWSALPSRFGSWHTVYTRVHRWSKSGVLDRVFEQMQRLQLIRLRLEVIEPDGQSTATAATGNVYLRLSRSAARTLALPQFAWVPRVRICHRRLAAARRSDRAEFVNHGDSP